MTLLLLFRKCLLSIAFCVMIYKTELEGARDLSIKWKNDDGAKEGKFYMASLEEILLLLLVMVSCVFCYCAFKFGYYTFCCTGKVDRTEERKRLCRRTNKKFVRAMLETTDISVIFTPE